MSKQDDNFVLWIGVGMAMLAIAWWLLRWLGADFEAIGVMALAASPTFALYALVFGAVEAWNRRTKKGQKP